MTYPSDKVAQRWDHMKNKIKGSPAFSTPEQL
jgi:hypothetical protein